MKNNIIILGITIVLSSCYSVKKSVKASLPLSKEINWPENYLPQEAKFFVHNEIDIDADPETIWSVLINASEWESYYQGASDLVLLDSPDGTLRAGGTFTWKTMGLDFVSSVKEFEAPYRLAWESNKKSINGWHAWLIIPTTRGSKLITSEAQHGFMTIPQKLFVPKKLEKLHDEWLTEIKHQSEKHQHEAYAKNK